MTREELIEKYLAELCDRTDDFYKHDFENVLTRFASEITVDAEKDELIKLLRVIEWKDQWSDSGEERCFWCHRSRIASNEHHADNCALRAAISAAGGGK